MIGVKSPSRWLAFLGGTFFMVVILLSLNSLGSHRSAWISEYNASGGWTSPLWNPHISLEGMDLETPNVDPSLNCPPLQMTDPLSSTLIAEEWDSSRVLKGLPTDKFKDNLRNGTYYITAWALSGFTNQFMSHVNMIYLGVISERVPVIAPFSPGYHLAYSAGALPFGLIFNLSRAREALRRPLLEWTEVKALPFPTSVKPPHPEEREQLGCWSTRAESNPEPIRVAAMEDNLRLDIAYTRIPNQARHDMKNKEGHFIDFSHVVPYIFPKQPKRGNFPIMKDSLLGHSVHPDEQMSCFDFLYYATSSHETYEWSLPWSPAWRRVGAHMHFTDELVDLTKGYLARAFQTGADNIPVYIGVHMRRGDFNRCHKDKKHSDQCLVPLEPFEKEVEKVRAELQERHNWDIIAVVIMSDESDPTFWEEVTKRGWARLDHDAEKTVEKHGEWYPPIIDQVAHSIAAGFVGTKDSTYSLVGARRVEDWNNGPTVLVDRNAK